MRPGWPNWYGYLGFLKTQVGLPAQVLPNNLFTAILLDSQGNPVIDSNGNWISTAGAWGIVTDSSGNNVVDNHGSPITGSLQYQWILASLLLAVEIVNETLAVSQGLYVMAVYNLAADRLINFATDQTNQTYWAEQRAKFKIYDVSVGVVSSTSDESTSQSTLNPESMRTFTLFDLQTLKTPYGRAYMGIAQNFGSSLWGLS